MKAFGEFSSSPANSIIFFEPLFNCLSEAQASSLTEPAHNRDNNVSLAASQVAPSSKLARMLLPVAQISSWHQVILALVSLYLPQLESLFQLCEPVRQFMLSVVVLSH